MSDYRVYIIGIDGHRFIKADQFMSNHPDDATAMKAAEQLVDGYDVELWDCARLVGRIAHKSRTNAIRDDQTKASGSDTDLANLRVVAGPIEKAADLRSKVEVSTAPDPPRDESAIILEDDASGTYDVAHWSPEAGEWVGENGEPTKITPSHWYSMPREKYLSLESDGSSNPSQVRPSPARARRYATFSIAAALVAAALIGTYFREDAAALVTRYAGQQDIFGGSTIGEQVVVRGTQLQSQDSQKTNSLALRQQEEAEADPASAQEAAQVKQAAESGTVGLRKSQQQEEERAKRLEQDLAAARHDVETQTALAAKASKEASELKQAAESGAVELRKSLQQEQERAKRLEQDLAAARLDVETQTAQAAKASDEAGQLKQVAESGSAELKRSLQQEHDRAEALAQDLSMARTTIYAHEAQSRKAGGEAADLKQAAESAALELRKSLQQERERAERLEQDLAAARHDVEIQTAQAARATTEAAELKQAAKSSAVQLRKSLQQEQEQAKRLEQDLAAARRDVETQTAQAARATTEATELKQVAKSGAAELRKSLQQEQERAARLQQDLAAARRDVETQGALAAKASAEAVQLKQLADSGEKLRISLQQEHDRAARPERDLAFERNARAAPAAPKLDQNAQDKQLEANADQASVAAVRGAAPPNPEDAAEVARLVARAGVLLGQGDIGSARIVLERAAESGSAQASFMLAETYDPLILPKWGTYGTRGDATKARDLYAQAEASGVKEAKARFDALRR
jgi:hypothetical protein